LFKSFGLGSTWSLREEYAKTYYKLSDDRATSTTSLGLYYRVLPNLDFTFTPAYSWAKTEGEKSTQIVSQATGFWYRLPYDASFRAEYDINNYDVKRDEGKWPRSWSILGSFIKNFNFSSPLRFGRIKGRVLEDINNNTVVDSSDKPIDGVRVKLQDGRLARTDKNGNFTFLYVAPELQKISLAIEDLPLDLAVRDPDREVAVEAFKTSTVTILLIKASSIEGRVFVDENNDRVFQETEEPLEGIKITLMPEEQVRITNDEGIFKFDNLTLGRYTITINAEDIPAGYELSSAYTKSLLVLPGEKNTDLNFSVRLKRNSSVHKF